MMRKLPGKEREIIQMEERRMKRLDLQEIKQNIWRKWRGKGGSIEEKRKETEEEKIERQTIKIEKTLKRLKDEKKAQDQKFSEWKERRKRLLEEGRKQQEESERKSRNRKIRIDKKAKMEEKWEMLRWTIRFIDDNKDRWERERLQREKSMEIETSNTWREKSREEKIETVKNGWKAEELVNNKKQFAKWRQENTSVAETSLNNGREDVMCQNNEMKMQGADVGLSLASYSEMENVPENETMRWRMPHDDSVGQSLAEPDKGGVTYDGADAEVGLSLENPDETEPGPESEARVGVTYEDAGGISLAEMESMGMIYDGDEPEVGLSLANPDEIVNKPENATWGGSDRRWC